MSRRLKIICVSTMVASVLAAAFHLSSSRRMRNTVVQEPHPEIQSIPKVNPPNVNLAGLNLRHKFNFINKVVERCAPAVVYVEIKDPRRLERGTDSALIVSNGSGFVVREDGWILTNAHVVISKPNAVIEVRMHDGTTYNASVMDADMNIDLALIKVNVDHKLPALNLAKSGDVNVGEWVVALGSPLSLSHSATAGVVSSVNRPAGELGLRNYQMRYIQTDAPITFGNSGGPLVNLDGDVIGINNLRITAGISFAIPVDYVMKFLERINKNPPSDPKKHIDNSIGVTAITVTPEILKDGFLASMTNDGLKQGVLIWKIVRGGAGEKSGLQLGDVITHVNGNAVDKANDVYGMFKEREKMLHVDIIRKGRKINLILNGLNNP